MKIKPAIGMIVLAFTSLILITGSPFQIATNLVENNGHLNYKHSGLVYGAEDDGGGDDGGGDDGGGEERDSDSSDGESEDSSFIGESFDDGSGSGDGSDEPTSTPVEDGTSNDAADVDSSPSEFFSASDEPTSTPDNSQPNLRTLSNPIVEPKEETTPSSKATTDEKQASFEPEAAEEKDCSSISEPDDDFYCKQFDWGAYHPDKQSVDELCDASEDYAKNPKHCDIAYGLVEKQDKNLKKDLEEACDKAGGKMKDGYCDVKENEKAIAKQSDKINEKICKKVDGKWTKEGCDFGKETDGPKADKFFEEQSKEPGAIVYDWSNNNDELYEEPTPVIED